MIRIVSVYGKILEGLPADFILLANDVDNLILIINGKRN